MKNIWREKTFQGSFTVEAALVIPALFLILAALMIVSFYFHDRAVCQSIICETASSGASFSAEWERKQAMEASKQQMKEERFLGSRELQGSAALGKKEVCVIWQGEYPVPGFVMKYFSDNRLSYRQSWTSRLPEPADTIRKIRGADNLVQELTKSQ